MHLLVSNYNWLTLFPSHPLAIHCWTTEWTNQGSEESTSYAVVSIIRYSGSRAVSIGKIVAYRQQQQQETKLGEQQHQH